MNKVQIAKVKDVLEKARIMNDEDLEALKCNISSSDGNLEVREVILEGIDSLINREKLTAAATVCDGDVKFDTE